MDSAPAPPSATTLPRPKRGSSAGSGTRLGGGDGLSRRSAIVIEAPSARAGIRAQYDCLTERFPGYTRVGQSLSFDGGGHVYDRLTFVTPDGERRRLYFDITSFFARLG